MLKPLFFLSLYIFATSLRLTAQDSLQQARINNKWAYFSIRPGLAVDHLNRTGEGADTRYTNRTIFFLSGAIDLENGDLGNFIIRSEVAYRRQAFQGKRSKNNKSYNSNMVFTTWTPDFSLFYRLPAASKMRVYGGGGVGWSGRKVHDEGEVSIWTQGWSLSISAGLMYKNRIDFNVKFWSANISDDAYYNLRNQTTSLIATYRF